MLQKRLYEDQELLLKLLLNKQEDIGLLHKYKPKELQQKMH
jgi:hypothetical protein